MSPNFKKYVVVNNFFEISTVSLQNSDGRNNDYMAQCLVFIYSLAVDTEHLSPSKLRRCVQVFVWRTHDGSQSDGSQRDHV